VKQEGKYTDTVRGRVDSIERLVETVPILSEIFTDCKITFYEEDVNTACEEETCTQLT